jgi:hypothetical protein
MSWIRKVRSFEAPRFRISPEAVQRFHLHSGGAGWALAGAAHVARLKRAPPVTLRQAIATLFSL